MKRLCKTLKATFFIVIFYNFLIYSHGLHKDALVLYDHGQYVLPLKTITSRIKKNKKQYVTSYDQQKRSYTEKRARAAGFSHVPYYYVVTTNNGECSPIICSPTQHFYRLTDHQWIPAHELAVEDKLLAHRGGFVTVTDITFVEEPLDVYTIHVKDTYTFLVGTHGIVVHNVILPVAAAVGVGIPFSTGCGGGLGAVFGPVGFVGGILLGAGFGVIVNACFKERYVGYGITLDTHNSSPFILNKDNETKSSEAQAPGKPTENDGFIPKKKWDSKKITHPVTGQIGWPDEKGNVWKPTGPGSSAHGGPHWDVVSKDGKKHWNILPGGKVRGAK